MRRLDRVTAGLGARFDRRNLQRRCYKQGGAERARCAWGENPEVRHGRTPWLSRSRRHSPPLSDETPRAALRFASGDRTKLDVQGLDVTGLSCPGQSKQIEIFLLLPLGH